MTRRKSHIHRAKTAKVISRMASHAATECASNLADADIDDVQRAFLIELASFNASRNMPRPAAERVKRKQQAARMAQRAGELFPGIPVEVS